MHSTFLPVSRADLVKRGWDQLDFILISGDAYVDHPSFGVAIIGRLLESKGYKVGIIAQPDWRSSSDFKRLGKPRLGFLIGSGNIDSMVNHYTVAKRKRRYDAYSPGGQVGLRPDRATIVYANRVKEAYNDVPIILGGIEASLRRLAHYDYWDNRVRRSIILDSRADLIVYGMGEKQIIEIADGLDAGIQIEHLTYIKGTAYYTKDSSTVIDAITLPSYEAILADKDQFGQSYKIQAQNTDCINGKSLIEQYEDGYVVQNPPADKLTTMELDSIYLLPYTRTYHPQYETAGGVPALTEVKFSLVSSRGCFGGCGFCALNYHQGRTIQARSIEAVVEEAKTMIADPDFKGYIHDVGGATANFRIAACDHQKKHGVCQKRQCLFPKFCDNLIVDHSDYLKLLRELRSLPGVKKVFIRSGIRYDYLLKDPNPEVINEIIEHHVSGQLRVAPEHVSKSVLNQMGKSSRHVYEKFSNKFNQINRRLNKQQYLVPYFMSSHPGSTLHDAIELAEFIRDMGYNPEQVQDFYPTPATLSTCIYYTGVNPFTNQPVYVARSPEEKAIQRALIQYRDPKNYRLVLKALKLANREDLIGYDKNALIRPPRQGLAGKSR